MAQAHPPFYSPVLQAWVVTGYADALGILRSPERFSSARVYGTASSFLSLAPDAQEIVDATVPLATLHMAASDPPDHTRLRRTMANAFTPQRIAAAQPRIRDLADGLIDGLAHGDHGDLVSQFAAQLALLSILSVIGVPRGGAGQVKEWFDSWGRLTLTEVPVEEQLQRAQDVDRLHGYLRDLVEQRHEEPRDDVASLLANVSRLGPEGVSLVEQVNMLAQLIAAGTHTTAYSLSTCLYRLLRNRRLWENVLDNPSTISGVVEEALRCNRSVRGLMRAAMEDAVVGGVNILGGSHLYLVLSEANRDPSVFADPDAFHPHRSDMGKHVTFGHGIHYCLGAPLARLEMKVALEALTTRLPSLRLHPAERVKTIRNGVVTALTQLPVEWDGVVAAPRIGSR